MNYVRVQTVVNKNSPNSFSPKIRLYAFYQSTVFARQIKNIRCRRNYLRTLATIKTSLLKNKKFCRKVALWACCYLRFCRCWVIFSWNTPSAGNKKILQLAALLLSLPVSLPMHNRCSRRRSWCWWTNSIGNTSGRKDLLPPSWGPMIALVQRS